jgi:uncharacterized protein YkwD
MMAMAVPAAAQAQASLPPLSVPTVPSVSAKVAGCAGAAAAPGSIARSAARAAVLCLLNQQRQAAGLPALRARRPLGTVAGGFARTMVRQKFFDHTSPSGSTLMRRVRRSSYLRGARTYALGENIAFGGGVLGTPAAIVAAWMKSAGHRANILNGRFRDIGIGIAGGLPVGGAGATYVTDFGCRG